MYYTLYSIAALAPNTPHYWRKAWYDEIILDHDHAWYSLDQVACEMRRDFEDGAQPAMQYFQCEDWEARHVATVVLGEF